MNWVEYMNWEEHMNWEDFVGEINIRLITKV